MSEERTRSPDSDDRIDGFKMSSAPGERQIDKPDLPDRAIRYDGLIFTEAVPGKMQLKRGTSGEFEVFCDEPPQVGGDGAYPTPMDYMGMAVGFCLLTQIARYAHMMKISVSNMSVKVALRKTLGGSLLKGTVFNRWNGVDTHLEFDSDASPEQLKHLIRNAKGGCFAEGLVVQEVPLNSTIVVNGETMAIDGITTDTATETDQD